MCHYEDFESLGEILNVFVDVLSLFVEVLSVPVKSIYHVYTLRATTLEPLTGEINNMDDFVPTPCSAVKP